ncbi:MAG: hypothetical protein LBV15_03075 [Planctomycetota bacterium]|nr:hypothetical protein [Planctomycetota bacterium]
MFRGADLSFRFAAPGRLRVIWRSWLPTLILPLAAAIGAVCLFTRDMSWESRWRESGRLGRAAERDGETVAARDFYEAALRDHPYDWETRLALADLLNYEFHDNAAALTNYLIAMAGIPGGTAPEETARQMRLLRLIRSGVVEDPVDAAEDMFLAVEAGTERAFRRRLSTVLIRDSAAYWEGWRRRGRGRIGSRRLMELPDGSYAAVLEASFPDRSRLSFRFAADARGVWRLELGFP